MRIIWRGLGRRVEWRMPKPRRRNPFPSRVRFSGCPGGPALNAAKPADDRPTEKGGHPQSKSGRPEAKGNNLNIKVDCPNALGDRLFLKGSHPKASGRCLQEKGVRLPDKSSPPPGKGALQRLYLPQIKEFTTWPVAGRAGDSARGGCRCAGGPVVCRVRTSCRPRRSWRPAWSRRWRRRHPAPWRSRLFGA